MNAASVAPAISGASTPPSLGALFDRVGLAGQQRLVDEEVARLEHPPVGRHQVARRQQTTSPGTSASPGTVTSRRRAAPARCSATALLRLSAACSARYSCTHVEHRR